MLIHQLLGFSACSALTIYYLQQDTQTASALLLGSVEELQQGTGKVRIFVLQSCFMLCSHGKRMGGRKGGKDIS